jgi:PIN domain nuclease of toxin-antitoxin system
LIAYLDTQVVIWLAEGNTKPLSRAAIRLIEEVDLLVSPMATFEFDILYEIRRTKMSWNDVKADLEYELGLRVCDLPFQRIISAARQDGWTRDPFDRLIVANAKANSLAYLISADEDIRKNYQRAVW